MVEDRLNIELSEQIKKPGSKKPAGNGRRLPEQEAIRFDFMSYTHINMHIIQQLIYSKNC